MATGFDHTYASAIVGAQRTHKRKEADFYPTPSDVTVALFDYLSLKPGTRVLEPACGDGALSKVAEFYGFDVTSSDIRVEPSIYGEMGVDFLSQSYPEKFDWMITNPPFNLAIEFATKGLDVSRNCAMLLKSQFWHAKSRRDFFMENRPSKILPLTWRPAFLEAERGKSPLMDVMWVIWTEGYSARCEFEPIQRPSKIKSTLQRKFDTNQEDDLLDLDGFDLLV